MAFNASNCLRSSRGLPRRDDRAVAGDGAGVGDGRDVK
jgi:hypothetical protein